MAYSELVKNFEKVRAYMREFYVYGFKSRAEYNAKSARSYDNERRRIESWLGDYMRFTQTSEGKNIFLSVDSRVTRKNPFYRAWKAKSFTDGDITLHFAIFDILYKPEIKKTLAELIEEIDTLLKSKVTFDESTLRKKLKEYTKEGIIHTQKEGRRVLYSRGSDTDISELNDVLDFFSEVAPCGVIGSFLQDKQSERNEIFSFKHHYITQAIDSDIMAILFEAINQHRYITIDNIGKRSNEVRAIRLVPLKIYISAQNGRQNLIAYNEKAKRLNSYRLDYMSNIRVEEPCDEFTALRESLNELEGYMWGVNCNLDITQLEHVEFEIKIKDDEQFIVNRLNREKRCGRVEKIDDNHYRYIANVFDTTEMIPWIRTFISRITRMNLSNRTVENKFKNDIKEMYSMYGIDGGNSNDI
ncbi:MAG: WYL domain-containing protein [Clostridia bacterium]|nr:WYL domain-containing protein [Clostridia bacterium]